MKESKRVKEEEPERYMAWQQISVLRHPSADERKPSVSVNGISVNYTN